jgi:hypothetical protein
MVEEKNEKRRLERIFFTTEDGITGSFIFSDRQTELDLLTANVINLSEGGLTLTLTKDKRGKIGIRDHIILTQVKGIKELEFLTNVEAEVKWILDDPSLGFIGFGCEFLNAPQSQRDAIRIFIDSWQRKTIRGSSEEEHG